MLFPMPATTIQLAPAFGRSSFSACSLPRQLLSLWLLILAYPLTVSQLQPQQRHALHPNSHVKRVKFPSVVHCARFRA